LAFAYFVNSAEIHRARRGASGKGKASRWKTPLEAPFPLSVKSNNGEKTRSCCSYTAKINKQVCE